VRKALKRPPRICVARWAGASPPHCVQSAVWYAASAR